ncbi:MAG: trypsin-like peptidase domain-containing protein [Candidatus Portnoybacteria bacterium]|nr:trypsin-like peptidase domain-containing protein [Candidatus Portnoybacteria bacterium]
MLLGKKIKGKLINLGIIILVGGLAGIFASECFLPWVAGLSVFDKVDWLQRVKEGVIIINKTEQVLITENEALENAIAKVGNQVVGVTSQVVEKTINKKKVVLERPEILAQGTGFIITSDGLVVAPQASVPLQAQQILVFFDNRQVVAEVKKRDDASGLALLKINESNLSVVSFSEAEPKLGERIFLIGAGFFTASSTSQNQLSKFVDLSIINQLQPNLTVDFIAKNISGAPIFNIKGEMVGVNLVESEGQNKIISNAVIKDLLK